MLAWSVACNDGGPSGRAFNGSILVGDTLRTFALYVPEAEQLGSAAPLILVFHGSGSSGAGMRSIGGFDALADREGFVVAYPNAPLGNWAERCGCNNADRLGVNDTGFVSALIDSLEVAFPIDPGRIYAAGLSQGGLFAHRLACDMADRFAAVVSVVGPISTPLSEDCVPGRPISVLTMMGTADGVFPFEGGGEGTRAVLGATATARHWADANGCTGAPSHSALPDERNDGTTIELDIWSTCNGSAEVGLYTVNGGVHTWNISDDAGTADLLVAFFLPHRR